MKRTFLGELEEILLLIVAASVEQVYGVTIGESFARQTGRVITNSTIHTTLQRLEKKGYLASHLGGATPERGGRRKRFFTITRPGRQALVAIQHLRNHLWQAIPLTKVGLMEE